MSFSRRACTVLVLLQRRCAFTNLSAGTLFPRGTIRCIRRMGLAILGTAAVELIMDAVMLGCMRTTTTVAGGFAVVPLDMLLVDFPLGTILAGLLSDMPLA